MAIFRQTTALCGWNFRGLGRRWRGAAVVAVGFFAVVLVFVAVLTVRDGIARSGVRPNAEAIARVSGNSGRLDAEALNTVGLMPGLAKDGGPAVAGAVFGVMLLRDWRPDMVGIAVIMGIDADKAAILPNFRVTAGRMFRPGLNEMMIGDSARRIFPEFDIGHTLEWQHRKWIVVGAYSTGSDLHDSQFLADLHQAQGALKWGNTYSWIFARLSAPAAFDRFKREVERQPFGGKAERLSDDDDNLGKQSKDVLTLADGVIALLMAVGAVFAALNVMYASVAARGGELAILRALGFSRLPILAAILSEAMALALIGGGLAIAVVALVLGNIETSTIMGNRLVSFRLAVTPSAIATALALTLGMGFLGGLFPAIRAARLPIAGALREG